MQDHLGLLGLLDHKALQEEDWDHADLEAWRGVKDCKDRKDLGVIHGGNDFQ
jgi:hypothetical protein